MYALWNLNSAKSMQYEVAYSKKKSREIKASPHSNRGKVTSRVAEGSVLAPSMFAVYANDMIKGVDSYMCLC